MGAKSGLDDFPWAWVVGFFVGVFIIWLRAGSTQIFLWWLGLLCSSLVFGTILVRYANSGLRETGISVVAGVFGSVFLLIAAALALFGIAVVGTAIYEFVFTPSYNDAEIPDNWRR